MTFFGLRAIALLLAPLAVACFAAGVSVPDEVDGAASRPARGEAQPSGGPAGWSAVSDSGRLRGRLVPESGEARVGQFQSWVLELHDSNGAAITGAEIAIGGGMPGHGHGLPTQPRVTEELAGGHYRIEGVKLNMYGDWVIEVVAQTATLRDRLRFDVAIDF
jgi:YtkA-like protein